MESVFWGEGSSEAAAEAVQTIDALRDQCYRTAVEHGWWEEGVTGRDDAPGPLGERSFGDLIALMHSELSEALEEFRDGRALDEVYFEDGKPEGIPIELADVIVRIFDLCGRAGIDIGRALLTKMEFNEGRPYRHGGRTM